MGELTPAQRKSFEADMAMMQHCLKTGDTWVTAYGGPVDMMQRAWWVKGWVEDMPIPEDIPLNVFVAFRFTEAGRSALSNTFKKEG
jgi:hypothetical protein